PGAGLWYLGRRKSAAVNLLVALVIPLMALSTDFLAEHAQWVFLAIAAGSAGIAHAASGSASESEAR
ncbi:MAG: hypothetical protein KDB01_26955, partial [Planctomycetaceae bacterium]|nr:hypothetical protein [Planctomycetaceae bacterium]